MNGIVFNQNNMYCVIQHYVRKYSGTFLPLIITGQLKFGILPLSCGKERRNSPSNRFWVYIFLPLLSFWSSWTSQEWLRFLLKGARTFCPEQVSFYLFVKDDQSPDLWSMLNTWMISTSSYRSRTVCLDSFKDSIQYYPSQKFTIKAF